VTRFAREQIVLDVHPKTQKIHIGSNMRHRQRDPPEQADGRQPEEAREYFSSAGGQERHGQGDGQRNKRQPEPCRSLRRTENRSQERPSIPNRASYECQSGGMQKQRHDRGAGEKSSRPRPIHCGGQRAGEFVP
jgi:hypothetical protein